MWYNHLCIHVCWYFNPDPAFYEYFIGFDPNFILLFLLFPVFELTLKNNP